MNYRDHLTRIGQAMSMSGFSIFICKPFDLSNNLTTIVSLTVFAVTIFLLYLSIINTYVNKYIILMVLFVLSLISNSYWIYKENDNTASAGITGYLQESKDIMPLLDQNLNKANSSVIFFGTNFHITVDEKRELIINLVKRGVRIKFLILDPETQYYNMVAKTIAPGEPLSSLKTECEKGILDLIRLQKEANSVINATGSQGELQVKLMDVIPQSRFYFIDPQNKGGTEIFVPYINGLLSTQSPAYLLNVTSTCSQTHYKSVTTMWSQAAELSEWESAHRNYLTANF